MPLYVYACQTCELELEEMHALGEAPEKSIRCPICGGYFERMVPPTGINCVNSEDVAQVLLVPPVFAGQNFGCGDATLWSSFKRKEKATIRQAKAVQSR